MRGEQAAFGELYDAYAGLLYRRVLFPMLGNAAAAEDALSETFRSAYQHLDTYRPSNLGVYPWLAKIAKNKALDMFRARKVTGRALANFEALLEPLLPKPPSPEQLLNEEVSQRALSAGIQRTLAQLNERYRTVIELRFFEEQPREACAAKLGVKLGTFDVLLLRALRAFRKQWEEQYATGALSHD